MTDSQTPTSYELLEYESIVSTNDFFKQPLPEGLDFDLPIFVRANEQTGGRGRLGRSWHSPKGGLYLSLLWPYRLLAVSAVSLPLVAALAVRFALQPLSDQQMVLKWPNDLLMEQDGELRKLAGILVELVEGKAVVGVGVNVYPEVAVNQARTVGSAEVGSAEVASSNTTVVRYGPLTAAWLAGGNSTRSADNAPSVDNSDSVHLGDLGLLEQARDALIHSLPDYLGRWQKVGNRFEPFGDEYRQHLARIGDHVEVRNAFGDVLAAGTMCGIDDLGQLIVQDGYDSLRIPSGEVTLRSDT